MMDRMELKVVIPLEMSQNTMEQIRLFYLVLLEFYKKVGDIFRVSIHTVLRMSDFLLAPFSNK
jgi:hypothetical protein